MTANYHTHTYRCQHAGKFREEEYIESAIANGFNTIGFSDHTPWAYASGYRSPVRMLPEQFPDYCRTVKGMKEQYAGRIQIILGLECEYYPTYTGWLEELKKQTDYMILVCHFAMSDEKETLYFGKTTRQEDLQNYFRSIVEAMKTGLYDYIAHPDLVFSNYPEFDSLCEEGSRMLCETAKKIELPLEFNISGYEKKETGMLTGIGFPNDRFWKIAKDTGCTAITGLDAHSPSAFSNSAGITKAESALRELGIRVIDKI